MAMENTNTKILEMRGITKKFGPVTVLDNVDFDVERGEVLALVGANGAGKSTLMKILNGIYTPTSGEIRINGEAVELDNPRDAFNYGISMIHQELELVENLSVAENIFLGREKMKGGTVQRPSMVREAQALLDSLNFPINAADEVSKLTTAKKQMILVARTVFLDSKLIVMDEPTSALSHGETQALFKVIHDLKEKGISIIYISHYLDEIFTVADRAVVLRNGQLVKTTKISDCTEKQLVEWMIGRVVERQQLQTRDYTEEPEVLRVDGMTQKTGYVHDAALTLHRGEVIGLAGAVGAGRSELLKMIYGAEEISSGKVFIGGEECEITSPQKAVDHKMGFVPEDRKLDGLTLVGSVGDNLALPELHRRSKGGIIDRPSVKEFVSKIVDSFHIKCTSPAQIIGDLSGGNQQKVAIGKWLSGYFQIILLDQPTRGVDVGSKSEIYQVIRELAEQKVSMIIASDEIEELQDLCDKILVMRKGEIIHEFVNTGTYPTKVDVLEKMVG